MTFTFNDKSSMKDFITGCFLMGIKDISVRDNIVETPTILGLQTENELTGLYNNLRFIEDISDDIFQK